MNPSNHSYTAEQWLDDATKNLNSLYAMFKDAGWQPDCSLLHGLSMATSQINEAVQMMRHAGPDGDARDAARYREIRSNTGACLKLCGNPEAWRLDANVDRAIEDKHAATEERKP